MPEPATALPRWRISLYLKVVLGLLVIVMTPLLVSAYLIDQIGKVAANFGANESAARDQALQRSAATYRVLFETTHRLHGEVAARLAARPEIAGLSKEAPLEEILRQEPGLVSIELINGTGTRIAQARRGLPTVDGKWQRTKVEQPLPGGARLRLHFAVLEDLRDELKAIGEIQNQQREIQRVRTALPDGYRRTFLIVMGLAVVVVIVIGLLAAWYVTRRIGVLVGAARKVSGGDTEARARLSGGDEMAELAYAFNTMLDGLDRQRHEIDYLQRIGAWQDVARKLAHEIKNPLTPIQLAVQQCVSAYQGDDPRYKKLLADTGEIVAEEIDGLRRLVDAFRTLGQLPRVEAEPMSLRDLIEDLTLDPMLTDRLRIHAGDPDVTVRADRLLFKRVLANLCENGVHAGQEAGRAGDVEIGWTVAVDRRLVAITVDDQGKGVTAEARARIFEPYVTTKATGTGLGLAIAKKIALEHGGTLEVLTTAAPTGGARFVVTLPLAET